MRDPRKDGSVDVARIALRRVSVDVGAAKRFVRGALAGGLVHVDAYHATRIAHGELAASEWIGLARYTAQVMRREYPFVAQGWEE
jgi:hypothetical protein